MYDDSFKIRLDAATNTFSLSLVSRHFGISVESAPNYFPAHDDEIGEVYALVQSFVDEGVRAHDGERARLYWLLKKAAAYGLVSQN